MVSQDLGRKEKRILQAIREYGGEARSPEVKEFTGIEESGSLHYFRKKLSKGDLIETWKVDDGPLGVTVWALTERGEEAIEGDAAEDGGGDAEPTLAEEVSRLRSHVAEVEDVVDAYQDRVLELEEEVVAAREEAAEVEGVEGDVEDAIGETAAELREDVAKAEAKSEAILGILDLFDVIDGEAVRDAAEHAVESHPIDAEGSGAGRAFQGAASGHSAGPILRALDSLRESGELGTLDATDATDLTDPEEVEKYLRRVGADPDDDAVEAILSGVEGEGSA